MSIKRYDWWTTYDKDGKINGGEPQLSVKGDWVQYKDVKHLIEKEDNG